MLSSVFVDRPRLAIVIAIVTTLAGLIAITRIPIAQFPDIVPPQVSVTARYPGASADVVETTIAQPIESQVNGVDNMLYMRSVSGNDGSYTLNVYFAVGTNPDINTVNVQNRLSLAEPKIPSDVRQQGLTVKKQSPALLQLIALYSPNGQRDSLFLANYGIINVIDALARVGGVGQALLYGSESYSMRIWFQTDVLTSLEIAPSDVIQRHPDAERPGCGRPDRRSTDFCRPGASTLAADQGPPLHAGRIREHHHPVESRRLRRTCPRRGAGGARRPVERYDRPFQRRTGGEYRHIPGPGFERGRDRGSDPRHDGGTQATLSGRRRLPSHL